MRTLLPDPPPAEIQEWLERRRRAGADRRDEVWQGVVHMGPAPSGEHADLSAQITALLRAPAAAAGLSVTADFNLGDSKEDFRVPDGGLHRARPHGAWIPTAALVLEIISPGDETMEKLPFYAAHRVDEVLIVDPDAHQIHWLALTDGEYREAERSNLIDLSATALAEQIDWP